MSGEWPPGWYPNWVQTKNGVYECTNWPPPHQSAYPGCVEWDSFIGHMHALAEVAYQRGQEDAANGIRLEKPWLYIGSRLDRLAEHIADAKAFRSGRSE